MKSKKVISTLLAMIIATSSVMPITAYAQSSVGSTSDNISVGEDYDQNMKTQYAEVEESNSKTKVALTVEDSDLVVSVPTTIIVSGTPNKSGKYIGKYTVGVSGNMSGDKTATIAPENSNIALHQNGKANKDAAISQEKTEFNSDDFKNNVTTNGTVTATGLTAGSWKGIANFNIGINSNLSLYNVTEKVEFMSNRIFSDSANYTPNSTYSTALVSVKPGETYYVSGYNSFYSRLYTLKKTLKSTENIEMFPAKGTVTGEKYYENIEVKIPDNCNYMVLCIPTNRIDSFKLLKLSNPFLESSTPDFYYDYNNEYYAIFTFDDSTQNTDQIEDLFEKYNVPACYSTIPSKLNSTTTNGETIKEVLNRAVANGGEVFVHHLDVLTSSSTDEDYYRQYYTSKKILEDNGFEINGFMVAGGTGETTQDYNKSTAYAKNASYLYSDYSNNYNIFDEQYRFARTNLDTNWSTVENYLKAIKSIKGGNCKIFFSHANNDFEVYEKAIQYCLENNIKIVTWKNLYDTCARTR